MTKIIEALRAPIMLVKADRENRHYIPRDVETLKIFLEGGSDRDTRLFRVRLEWNPLKPGESACFGVEFSEPSAIRARVFCEDTEEARKVFRNRLSSFFTELARIFELEDVIVNGEKADALRFYPVDRPSDNGYRRMRKANVVNPPDYTKSICSIG